MSIKNANKRKSGAFSTSFSMAALYRKYVASIPKVCAQSTPIQHRSGEHSRPLAPLPARIPSLHDSLSGNNRLVLLTETSLPVDKVREQVDGSKRSVDAAARRVDGTGRTVDGSRGSVDGAGRAV